MAYDVTATLGSGASSSELFDKLDHIKRISRGTVHASCLNTRRGGQHIHRSSKMSPSQTCPDSSTFSSSSSSCRPGCLQRREWHRRGSNTHEGNRKYPARGGAMPTTASRSFCNRHP